MSVKVFPDPWVCQIRPAFFHRVGAALDNFERRARLVLAQDRLLEFVLLEIEEDPLADHQQELRAVEESLDGLLVRRRAPLLPALEERKLEYVLGVRQRRSAEVRSTVIDDQTPFVPLVVPRVSGELTELEAQPPTGLPSRSTCRAQVRSRCSKHGDSRATPGWPARSGQSTMPTSR